MRYDESNLHSITLLLTPLAPPVILLLPLVPPAPDEQGG